MESLTKFTFSIVGMTLLSFNVFAQGTKHLHSVQGGQIKLNGPIPENFKVPSNEENFTVYYLGNIPRTSIEWLPFE